MRYLFEEYAFDTDRRELHRGALVVSVTPQVFDLLDYLIRNRERVVSKDELITAIWNGRSVSDAALTTRLNAARNAIGDTGEKQRLIKTLARKGFRFVGVVQEQRPIAQVDSLTRNDGTAQRTFSPPRLSIVVLPFVNLSGDPEQDYFVDGVTESLTTDLSRISGAFIIARNTAFTFKGKAVDVLKLGRELNVRYVLEGSVQRGGNRLRVNVQLVDTETGNQLWAERFEKPIGDLFDMQDEIVSRLANALDAELLALEARRAERSPNPDATDLCFQGAVWLNMGRTPENMTRACGFYERALALEPTNVEALVGRAWANFVIGANLVSDDRVERLAAAETTLAKALSLAPNHPLAHNTMGLVKIFTNRAAQGIAECQRALTLDRNLARSHAGIGVAKFFLGRGGETEAHMEQALRLSPRDTLVYVWSMFVGLAKFWQGADAEALVWLRRSLEANRNYPAAHFNLAAALALVGELDEARATAQAGLALNPSFTIRRYRTNTPSNHPLYLAGCERVYEGLRLAGVREG
ncbi:winged helix-turn-helix domain-containing protein [Bradyrhizobium liaoningense]|uniref:winged helix-turn-helix domain-containing tetratricopeptide repeat protein n=1 Tax=Bradyrhizobium liaoningense TaxID=43992 RepID=UPI001BA5A562|nr:winged helix-turn-helix domain-containing protein [Bradyrhizobium liaoningense]MBR0719671.1 winged helix-turn-helix domain-containing protein [Bradyrhizobium liaoningense]